MPNVTEIDRYAFPPFTVQFVRNKLANALYIDGIFDSLKKIYIGNAGTLETCFKLLALVETLFPNGRFNTIIREYSSDNIGLIVTLILQFYNFIKLL
mgnify:CR=1 FL=1